MSFAPWTITKHMSLLKNSDAVYYLLGTEAIISRCRSAKKTSTQLPNRRIICIVVCEYTTITGVSEIGWSNNYKKIVYSISSYPDIVAVVLGDCRHGYRWRLQLAANWIHEKATRNARASWCGLDVCCSARMLDMLWCTSGKYPE